MQITVTQEDVERGTPGDKWCCPLAWALFRATGKKYVVCSHHVRPVGEGHLTTSFIPEEATKFIQAFDAGATSQLKVPVTFEISL